MSVIGLDIGTTGCKAIVFDREGRILGQGAREYPILTPHPRWAEQEAEQVFRLAWEALVEAVSKAPQKPDALALSVQGEAVIPVDGEGSPLRPAMLGMDTRTDEENEWLIERFGADTLFGRTGMPPHTINTLPKLLWLKKHEQKTWVKANQFLLYEDFFLRRLGGQAVISHCLASRTQMYDLSAGEWDGEILDACDIDPSRLSPLAPEEGGAVGSMLPELVESLGLSGEVLLVSGGHDQACAALGSGVTEEGLAMVSTGTAEVVETAMAKPILDELLILPHFSGSGTPLLDTSSKGAILGLTFDTTRATLAKAMLEGLTFELRVNIDLLREAGLTIRELIAVGGGARSLLWLQMKADICKVPLRVPEITEAACLGAALLSLAAKGEYPDVSTTAARVVRSQRRIEPKEEESAAYDARYQLYLKVYPALKEIHHTM